MKKIILSTLSIALLAGGISSCGKSTKGKMSNEWTIDSYEVKEVDTQSNGDVTTTTTTFTGTTVTRTETDSPSGQSSTTTTESGTVSQADYTIEKDGTWKMTVTYSFTSNPTTGITIVSDNTQTTSGTWAFVGKNKEEDFKKNERVLFNTLQSTNSQINKTTIGNNTTTSTASDATSYMTGENVTIYTITESKAKELQLTSEAKQSGTSNNSTNSYGVTTTLNLKEK